MQADTNARIKSLFDRADGILILAGAGMSVDSGLPDFRGSTGLWTQAKDDFIKQATARGFDEDPLAAWRFYARRMLMYAECGPHAGYHALLRLVTAHGKDHFVVTSNVDGYFIRAGFDPDRMHEIHGNLRYAQCNQPCTRDLYPMPRFTAEPVAMEDLPSCPHCGHVLRPNVMMFSDSSLVWRNIDAGEERYRRWAAAKMQILGIEIGAGTVIPSIRWFGEERTANLIRINPHDADVNRRGDISMAATALDGINGLIGIIG